jgi:hypothetical protein
MVPWGATVQGGEPASPSITRPHLRILTASHNRNSGREYQGFRQSSGAIACGLGSDGAAFLVSPHPLTSLINVAPDEFAATSASLMDIKSESICTFKG